MTHAVCNRIFVSSLFFPFCVAVKLTILLPRANTFGVPFYFSFRPVPPPLGVFFLLAAAVSTGREEVQAFLTRKWSKEQGYRLKKHLWSFEVGACVRACALTLCPKRKDRFGIQIYIQTILTFPDRVVCANQVLLETVGLFRRFGTPINIQRILTRSVFRQSGICQSCFSSIL